MHQRYYIEFRFTFYLLLSFSLLNVIAAQPDTLWTRIYDWSDNDFSRSIQQTFDGGFIVTGGIRNTNSYLDLVVIKTDTIGNIVWANTYGGNNEHDYGESVQQTSDGGYIVTGNTRTYGTGNQSPDMWLLRIDSTGNTLWTLVLGDIGSDVGYSVKQTSDGGFIVAGTYGVWSNGNDHNAYLVRTNFNGDTLWTKQYNTYYGFAQSVLQTDEGDFVIGGYSGVHFIGDGWLIKTNSMGDTLWMKFYGGDLRERIYDVKQTQDNGFILIGSTTSFGAGGRDFWLIKTNSIGDTLWTKTYGGSEDDWGMSVIEKPDGTFLLGGFTKSYGAGDDDAWLLLVTSEGDTIWTRTIGGATRDQVWSAKF